DLHMPERQVARYLIAKKHADLFQELAEGLGGAVLVADEGELVLHQRMSDDRNALHGMPRRLRAKKPCRRWQRGWATSPPVDGLVPARGRPPNCRLAAPWPTETRRRPCLAGRARNERGGRAAQPSARAIRRRARSQPHAWPRLGPGRAA